MMRTRGWTWPKPGHAVTIHYSLSHRSPRPGCHVYSCVSWHHTSFKDSGISLVATWEVNRLPWNSTQIASSGPKRFTHLLQTACLQLPKLLCPSLTPHGMGLGGNQVTRVEPSLGLLPF